MVDRCPYPQVTRRSLAQVGYSNMLPSWPSRPLLLSGDAASRYLSSLIKPGARKLKYRCIVPKATPRPLPPHISEMFNSFALIRCTVLFTQLRWGSTTVSGPDIHQARYKRLMQDPCPFGLSEIQTAACAHCRHLHVSTYMHLYIRRNLSLLNRACELKHNHLHIPV